jgi:hypothetical protein
MADRNPSRASGALESAIEALEPEEETLLFISLNKCLEAEANFIGLHDVAIGRVEDAGAKAKLTEFRADHVRRVAEIRGLLDEAGGPILAEETPTPVGRAFAEILQEAGTVDDLMLDFLASEDFSRRFYRFASSIEAPEPIVRVLRGALDDEERHYRWAVENFGAATGE